ncbi:MAG: Crp/Fnr family transcriptional regulator [Dehalococcoidia bacterium]|nr:Crp/Fnr family transcriptional regulator [Dehalococcoidia bacterium]MCB9492446.1 Crp/Fnr family transcriptional regulator [Dehalococcoidia bacterium]
MATGNALLDELPEGERVLLLPYLRPVEVERGVLLMEAGAAIESVEFPVTMVASLLSQTREGDPIEVAMIGPEGILGAWAASGIDLAPWTATAQLGGESLRLGVQEFRQALVDAPVLRDRVQRYGLTQTFMMSQSILCNRFHDLPQRAARWLLIFASKATASAGPLPVTQEMLSHMLGVHRPSVTLALQTLADAGLIRSEGRGLIAITDRPGLEVMACECFQQVQTFNASVTGQGSGRFGPAGED